MSKIYLFLPSFITIIFISFHPYLLFRNERLLPSQVEFILKCFIFWLQLNQIPATDHQKEINGFIEKSPIYVTSINSEYGSNTQLKSYDHIPPEERLKSEELGFHQQGIEDPEVTSELELKQELSDERTVKVFDQPRTSVSVSERHSPFANGRTEVLIGQDGSSLLRTTAVVEHNRLLTEDPDVQLR